MMNIVTIWILFKKMSTDAFLKLPEDKRIHILDSAAHIFAMHGYHKSSIVDICKSAGISNGALYLYFENKEGVYRAVAKRTLEIVQSAVDLAVENNKSIWDRLRAGLELVPLFSTFCRDYLVVYMEMHTPHLNNMETFSSELSDIYERKTQQFYTDMFQTAIKNKEIRAINPTYLAYILDTNVMLFAFSCVSRHYDRRFKIFMEKEHEDIVFDVNNSDHTNKRINLILKMFYDLLQ